MSDFLQDAAVAAAQFEATAFADRYPAEPPNVQFISFADVQKGIVANATQLGFIDTTNPWCARSFLTRLSPHCADMYACSPKHVAHAHNMLHVHSLRYCMQNRVSIPFSCAML